MIKVACILFSQQFPAVGLSDFIVISTLYLDTYSETFNFSLKVLIHLHQNYHTLDLRDDTCGIKVRTDNKCE
jgi:hypothetical protein